MRQIFAFYEFSDGTRHLMSKEQAVEHATKNKLDITKDPSQSPVIHGIKDGFKPGFNRALGMEIKDRGHYNRVLKEKGLIEVGKESLPGKKAPVAKFTDKELKGMHDDGIKFSGREIDNGVKRTAADKGDILTVTAIDRKGKTLTKSVELSSRKKKK